MLDKPFSDDFLQVAEVLREIAEDYNRVEGNAT